MESSTPRQRELSRLLGLMSQVAPTFHPALLEGLKAGLEKDLSGVAEEFTPEQPLRISKHLIKAVSRCEGLLLAQDSEPFEWKPSNIKGRILHRAIEKELVPGPRKDPIDRIEEAVEYFQRDAEPGSIGASLLGLTQDDLHDLKRHANDAFVKFVTDWPEIPRVMAPRPESRITLELCDDRIVVKGVVDLVVGRPEGSIAKMVLIDFKTGQQSPVHLDDLRMYALMEAFRSGTPPARVLSYYLDSGKSLPEEVTDETLKSAAARLADGVRRIAAVRSAGFDAAARDPGPHCNWCFLSDECDTGTAWLAVKEAIA